MVSLDSSPKAVDSYLSRSSTFLIRTILAGSVVVLMVLESAPAGTLPVSTKRDGAQAGADRTHRSPQKATSTASNRVLVFPGQIESVLEEALKEYENLVPVKRLLQVQSSAKEQIRATDEEAPLTLESKIFDTYFFPDSNESRALSQLRKKNSVTSKNTLSYALRNSLTTQLTATYSTDSYQSSLLENQSPYSIGILVSYDWVQGGSNGASETSARSTSKKIEQSNLQIQAQLLDTKIRFAGLWVDLYSSLCKQTELKSAQDLVAHTIETGKAQLKTRTISYKDFLNFNDLDNSFSKRKANIDATVAQIVEQIETYGDRSRDLALNSSKATLACEINIAAISEKINKLNLNEASIERLIKLHPSYQEANAGLDVARLQIRSAELGSQVSFGPFIGYDHAKSWNTYDGLGSVYGGLQLKWNPQGDKGSATAQYAEMNHAAARDGVTKTFYDVRAKMSGLLRQARSQLVVGTVLDRSVKNLEELIHTLEVQRKLGSADSLNFTNSYLNKIDAIHARIDAWASLQKINLELREYHQLIQ